jgi:hypothetical protein
MNSELHKLVLEYLHNPKDAEIIYRLHGLQPTDHDYDDEFFDSLEPWARRSLYTVLCVLCGTYVGKVLERRAEVETDEECRKTALEALKAAIFVQGKMASVSTTPALLNYPKRTPEFASTLKALVLEYLHDECNPKAMCRVSDLDPTDHDFNDSFFDSFEPQTRQKLYAIAPFWCRPCYSNAILARRAKKDPDKLCRTTADVLLRCRHKH